MICLKSSEGSLFSINISDFVERSGELCALVTWDAFGLPVTQQRPIETSYVDWEIRAIQSLFRNGYFLCDDVLFERVVDPFLD